LTIVNPNRKRLLQKRSGLLINLTLRKKERRVTSSGENLKNKHLLMPKAHLLRRKREDLKEAMPGFLSFSNPRLSILRTLKEEQLLRKGSWVSTRKEQREERVRELTSKSTYRLKKTSKRG
jgi:hypothetical protein